MGLYNFKPQFAPFVLDGTKRHTIRAERKHADSIGNLMHLYTGLRTRKATLLMRARCVRTEFIRIETSNEIKLGFSLSDQRNESTCYGSEKGGPLITLSEEEANRLAYADGFRADDGDHIRLMMGFWTDRKPFVGTILHWQYNVALREGDEPLPGEHARGEVRTA